MIFNSIRWRLQAWHGLILAAVVAGFGVTAYQLEHAHLFRRVDQQLQERISLLATTARPPAPSGGGPPRVAEFRLPANVAAFFGRGESNDFYYAVWQPDGKVQRSTNAPPDLAPPERVSVAELQPVRQRGTRREAAHFTPAGRCILVGRAIDAELAGLRQFTWILAAGGGAVLALGLAGGWWASTRALRPVGDISATAEKISGGNLSQRINTADTDSELDRLADVLNSTFARLEAAFAQQKQFTADASHELRTPLAVLISEAQTTLTRERSNAEYRETIAACLDTAQQMRRLTESLLDLARLDAGQENFQCAPLDLVECARVCIEHVRPLAAERGIQIHADFAPAPLTGDAERLNQVVTNLLTNAIHYNRDGGEIRVATRRENDSVILTVADTGQGIAAEDLPRIFERFYRADKSRARTGGRSGLGLAICQAIMAVHGGSIEATSETGQGATFTVRLPGK